MPPALIMVLAAALGMLLAPHALARSRAGLAAKHIDWYTEDCAWGNEAACSAALEFATVTHPELVDGIMPCCNVLQIDCATGLLQYDTSHYNFSGFAPFLAAGKTVSVALEGWTAAANMGGMAACCKSASNCTMMENKEALAQQLLELALKFKLTSFTGDWEFDGQADGFYWLGWNETMAHIASVLKPHGVGLGNSIESTCHDYDACNNDEHPADPCCCPAYRNVPWADVLTDMGTYSIGDAEPSWSKNGTSGSCPNDPTNDPNVIQYCGFEGGIMNVLHSPVAKYWPSRAPQLSPGLWIGDCLANGTATAHGWTQPKLHSFLQFLDTQGVNRIGLWCMTNDTDPIGFPCPMGDCHWIYDELQAWKATATRYSDE